MQELSNKEIAQALGRAGGQSTLKKYGKGHFQSMVQKRWAKVKEDKAKASQEISAEIQSS